MSTAPVLAVDLGGTKILAALVQGSAVLERREMPTDRSQSPTYWLDQIQELVRDWSGDYDQLGITVTGLIQNGMWSAMSLATLNLTEPFPLAQRAQNLFGRPVALANDAQAAAWGEYRHGAGAGRDMVFVTVSTGIGGGIVSGGRLLSGRSGLAGHIGLTLPQGGVDSTGDDTIFEARASGPFIASAANTTDAKAAFAATGDKAQQAIDLSAARVARLLHNLQLVIDPEVVVIGGGVGLAPGYIDRLDSRLAALPALTRPTLARAALGADAGVIGIAALAIEQHNREERP